MCLRFGVLPYILSIFHNHWKNMMHVHGSYLGPHWQSCVEGLHSFVELSTEVVKDPKARLQIPVDAVGVVLNCFQEELLDLRLQGAAHMHR